MTFIYNEFEEIKSDLFDSLKRNINRNKREKNKKNKFLLHQRNPFDRKTRKKYGSRMLYKNIKDSNFFFVDEL